MRSLDFHERVQFPNPLETGEHGIVAQGGNVSPGMLLSAYEQGIFPWYDEAPVLWHSPDPRFLLRTGDFSIPKRFLRTLRAAARPVIRVDSAFDAVMRTCRDVRQGPAGPGSWINQEMISGYGKLHRQGFAHSVEVWMDGTLAGGLYGVSIGSMFAGESMFSKRPGASKFALVALMGLADEVGIPWIDCQTHTPYLASFGGQEVPRRTFLSELAEALVGPADVKAAFARLRDSDDVGPVLLPRAMARSERNRQEAKDPSVTGRPPGQ